MLYGCCVLHSVNSEGCVIKIVFEAEYRLPVDLSFYSRATVPCEQKALFIRARVLLKRIYFPKTYTHLNSPGVLQ